MVCIRLCPLTWCGEIPAPVQEALVLRLGSTKPKRNCLGGLHVRRRWWSKDSLTYRCDGLFYAHLSNRAALVHPVPSHMHPLEVPLCLTHALTQRAVVRGAADEQLDPVPLRRRLDIAHSAHQTVINPGAGPTIWSPGTWVKQRSDPNRLRRDQDGLDL